MVKEVNDYISRADAIEAVYRKYPYNAEQNKCDEMVDALKALPSADRPSGEWTTKDGVYGVAYCSNCGYELKADNTNYCPNCGARMTPYKGGENE